MARRRTTRRRTVAWVVGGVGAAIALVVGAVLFQPWLLFVDVRVADRIPHVWLSAGPVVEGRDGWYTAASYDHVDPGPLRGDLGDQLYDIPAEVDLSTFRTLDLWCERFGVSFGAAALS